MTRFRLETAFRGRGAILLRARVLSRTPRAFTFALPAFLLAAGLGYAIRTTWGSTEISPLPSSLVGAFFVLLLSGLLGALSALAFRAWKLRRRLPFLPGIYLFAGDLIEVHGAWLRCVPTRLLTSVREAVDPRGERVLVLHFSSGESYTFPQGETSGDSFFQQIEQLRDALEQARASGDSSRLECFDPLWIERSRPNSPLVHATPRRHPSSWLLRPALRVTSVAAGSALAGLVAVGALSTASEQAAMLNAARQNDAAALLSLAARGGAIGPKADGLLLSMALRNNKPDLLLLYQSRGIHQEIAQRALLERFRNENNLPGLQRLLERCPDRQTPVMREADALLLELSQRAENPILALQEYLQAGGLEQRKAREELIPAARLSQFIQQGEIEKLWDLHNSTASPWLRGEVRAALELEYEHERQRLASRRPTRMSPLLSELLLTQATIGLPMRFVVEADTKNWTMEQLLREVILESWANQINLKFLRLETPTPGSLPNPQLPLLRVVYDIQAAADQGMITLLKVTLERPGQPLRQLMELQFQSDPVVSEDILGRPHNFRQKFHQALDVSTKASR